MKTILVIISAIVGIGVYEYQHPGVLKALYAQYVVSDSIRHEYVSVCVDAMGIEEQKNGRKSSPDERKSLCICMYGKLQARGAKESEIRYMIDSKFGQNPPKPSGEPLDALVGSLDAVTITTSNALVALDCASDAMNQLSETLNKHPQ